MIHTVSSPCANGNGNNSRGDCYIEITFLGYQLCKYTLSDNSSTDAKCGSNRESLQRLNRLVSICFIAIFSIMVIVLAFAVQQILVAKELREKKMELTIINQILRKEISNSKEEITNLKEEISNLREEILREHESNMELTTINQILQKQISNNDEKV